MFVGMPIHIHICLCLWISRINNSKYFSSLSLNQQMIFITQTALGESVEVNTIQ